MTLQEGITHKEGKYIIPDSSRNDLPQFFVDRGYKVGAEIGVCRGDFTEKLLKPGLKVFAVDSWTYHKLYPQRQARLDQQYEEVKNRLAPYDCTIIRKTSMEAVEDFADGSLDFVYIDANHHFRYIAEDICEWTKKVRVGGIVCGHDYFYQKIRKEREDINSIHVRWVVDAYLGAYEISNYYIIGRLQKGDLIKQDDSRWPSWMFIKE